MQTRLHGIFTQNLITQLTKDGTISLVERVTLLRYWSWCHSPDQVQLVVDHGAAVVGSGCPKKSQSKLWTEANFILAFVLRGAENYDGFGSVYDMNPITPSIVLVACASR